MLKIAVIASVSILAAVSGAKTLTAFGESHEAHASETPRVEVAMTAPAPPRSTRGARIDKSDDGHFWADARVNGSRVHFLVDTGATAVALRAEDARRLGINPASLDYDYQVSTAAGPALAAHVMLDSVSVDNVRVHDVEAFVVASGLDTSLLGMSYLGRLSGFEATNRSLVLNP